jgi:hypothetical protein
MSTTNTQQIIDQQASKSASGAEASEPATPPPAAANNNKFDASLIKKYPRSTRKVSMRYGAYSISSDDSSLESTQSMHISPHGIEFQTTSSYSPGTLLRIQLDIPDYWQRKLRFVQYRRIDQPARFPILAKVVSVQDVGRRGKKKIVTVQTVNIDETDELVLKSYLQEG